MLALAIEEDLVVRLERKPGHYVVASGVLATIWPGSLVTDRVTHRVRSLFVLGHQRTPDQDIEFGVNQLVEIAVRALSPGLNDPFTAITCVDQLGSVLCRLATRDMPSHYRYDHENRLRVIAPANTFPEFTDAAFNQLRQHSRSLPDNEDRRAVEERRQAVMQLSSEAACVFRPKPSADSGAFRPLIPEQGVHRFR